MFPSTYSSSSSTPPQLFQDFLGNVHSRRLLLHTPLHQFPVTAAPPGTGNGHDSVKPYMGQNSFDANVVMILSVLLCALICALGLNSIVRCALRCSSRVVNRNNTATRLANTGVNRKALKTFHTLTYLEGLVLPGLDSECVICLSEFAHGERIKILPKCNHGFHARCIDKWLMSHSSCPTCRHCLTESCQKITSCSQASLSEPPLQERILPLEPEGLIRNYHGTR